MKCLRIDQKPIMEKKVKKGKTNSKTKKTKRKAGSSNSSISDGQPSTKKSKAEEQTNEPVDEHALKGAFENFNISPDVVEKLKGIGVKYLFPVQTETFKPIMEGQDVITQARTGTGKTIAFAVPIIERLLKESNFSRGRAPKVLVLAPTRELAKQTGDVFEKLCGKLSVTCVYGGTPYGPQERAIHSGLDVLVGTPGRILDLVQKKTLNLDELQYVVLDEVDRMLDMGFADIVDDIIKHRYQQNVKSSGTSEDKNPQTLLFSATLPKWVHQTARKYMSTDVNMLDLVGRDSVQTSTTVEHLAVRCNPQNRESVIADMIQIHSGKQGRSMVFCETKREADELALSTTIKQDAHVLHGDIPQSKREMVLKKFRSGRYRCLVTTDVAARGLDIPEIDIVIQCTPPKDVDSYIHRSGRTGRAGRTGISVLLYGDYGEGEVYNLERRCGIKFKRVGAPTAEDVLDSSGKDAIRALDEVHEQAVKMFEEQAQEVIEKLGAVQALAAALAVISGQSQPETRSLINATRGFTTYIFRTDVEMNRLSFAWRILERKLSNDIKDKIQRMTFCADRKSCVFDIPSDLESEVEDRWVDSSFEVLEKATELPELEERQQNWNNSGSGQRGGNRRGYGDWNSGGGNRRGNRGYGNRGYGDRSYGDQGYGDQGYGGRSYGNRGGYQSRGRDSYGSSRGRGRGRDYNKDNYDSYNDLGEFSYAN